MFGQKKQLLSYPSAAPFETFVTDAQLIKFMCIKNAKNLKTLVLTDAESFSYPLDGCYPENVYLGASVTGIDVRNFYGEENGNTVLKIKNLYYAGTPERWESVKKLYANQTYVLPEVKYGSLEYDGTFAIGGNKDEILNIPEEINGMPVTTLIGDSNDVSSKVINIPKTVTAIKDDAFESCYELTEINVDPENKFFTSENGILYNKDKTVLISVPYGLDSVKLPYGIKTLKSYAISMCENLKAIVIPNTVTNIESSAIYCCGSLESITLSSGLKSIENYIIRECKSLQSLTVPEGVETINGSPVAIDNAFKYMILPVSLKDAGGNLGYVPYFAFKVKYMGTSEQWEAIINAPQCAEISFSASAVPVSVRETTAGTEVCVTPQNMEHGAKLMLAFYDGEKLVQCSTVSYTGQSVTSVCSKQFDRVKAMAVSADGSFKPLSDFGEIRYK